MRHNCSPNGNWPTCVVCDGRIHFAGCTTKPDPKKDCCAGRHKMLHDAGQVRGIYDDSFLMWTPEHPNGLHEKDEVLR